MKAKSMKAAVQSAYQPHESYPRRKPYSLSPAFDVATIIVAVVSAVGYLLS